MAGQDAALQCLLLELEVTALVVHVLEGAGPNDQLLTRDLAAAADFHAEHRRKEADVAFLWYFAVPNVSRVCRVKRIVAGRQRVVPRRAGEAMNRGSC